MNNTFRLRFFSGLVNVVIQFLSFKFLILSLILLLSGGYISSQENIRNSIYYPNYVSYNILYTNASFYNINNNNVSFSGIGLGIYSGWLYKIPLSFSVTYFFPKEYNGQLILASVFDSLYPKVKLLDSRVTGSGLALEINFTIKTRYLSYSSKSEDFGVYPQFGFAAFTQLITFNDNNLSYERLSYWCTGLQGLTLGTVNLGVYSRLRIAGIPLCLKISQNILVKVENYYTKHKVTRNYSSYLNVALGFTFPVTRGGGLNKIKTIEYK